MTSQNDILEAAIAIAGRLPRLEDHYSGRALEAANKEYPRGIALKPLLMTAAMRGGFKNRNFSSQITFEVLRCAFRPINASGFSSVSLPNILVSIANKFLTHGFEASDTTPLDVASVRSVPNLRSIRTASLVADIQFEQVGPAGEIKHANLSEEFYTNKADSYARMLAVTREHILNDDIGAITDGPRQLGRGSALMLNKIFWAKFLDNASFFTSGNKNVAAGPLTSESLNAAVAIFNAQRDAKGNSLGVKPKILMVPSSLEGYANELMHKERQMSGKDDRGRFRVVSSPFMSDPRFVGNSETAWYLISDPSVLPAIEIVALNGRVEPMVETADADFDRLGIDFKGYSDVGVEKQEFRAAVRSPGT